MSLEGAYTSGKTNKAKKKINGVLDTKSGADRGPNIVNKQAPSC